MTPRINLCLINFFKRCITYRNIIFEAKECTQLFFCSKKNPLYFASICSNSSTYKSKGKSSDSNQNIFI